MRSVAIIVGLSGLGLAGSAAVAPGARANGDVVEYQSVAVLPGCAGAGSDVQPPEVLLDDGTGAGPLSDPWRLYGIRRFASAMPPAILPGRPVQIGGGAPQGEYLIRGYFCGVDGVHSSGIIRAQVAIVAVGSATSEAADGLRALISRSASSDEPGDLGR